MAGNSNGTKTIKEPQVWYATYAGVEVFQQLHHEIAVMRRCEDSYMNATQLLKCAQYDKTHRSRFLERQIHTGVHEKVQGGYGKYQGTWVPLDRAITLARELGIYESLRPLFEYSPESGNSTPTAPKSLEAMARKRKAKSGKIRDEDRENAFSFKRHSSSGQSSASTLVAPQPTDADEVVRQLIGCMATPPSFKTGHLLTPPSSCKNNINAISHIRGKVLRSPSANASAPPASSQTMALRDISSNFQDISNRNASAIISPTMVGKQSPFPLHTPPSYTSHQNTVVATSSIRPPIMGTFGDGDGTFPQTPTGSYSRPPPFPGILGSSARDSTILRLGGQDEEGSSGQPTPSSPSTTNNNSNNNQSNHDPVFVELLNRLTVYLSCPPPAGAIHNQQQRVPCDLANLIRNDPRFDPDMKLESWPERPTYLHLSIECGHWAFIRLLMDRGADPYLHTRTGQTSLMLAVQGLYAWQHRGWRVFEWLQDIFKGTLIKRDKRGRTAVHWACCLGNNNPQPALYYVRLLVAKLAEMKQMEVLSWSDYSGKSACQLAMEAGLDDVHQLLSDAIDTPSDSIWKQMGVVARTSTSIPTGSVSHPPPILGSRESTSSMSSSPLANMLLENQASQNQLPDSSASAATGPVVGSSMDPYEKAISKMSQLFRNSIKDMRTDHKDIKHQLHLDTQLAMKELQALKTDRDAAKVKAGRFEEIARQCQEAEEAETDLRRKVAVVIGLQQSTRASLVLQPSCLAAATKSCKHIEPKSDQNDLDALRAEHKWLKQQAEYYERESLELAKEYSELTAAVPPWDRSEDDSSTNERLSLTSILWNEQSDGDREIRETAVAESESADVKDIERALKVDKERFDKLERVVAAACGDLPLDKMHTVVGSVLSVLNNGNAV